MTVAIYGEFGHLAGQAANTAACFHCGLPLGVQTWKVVVDELNGRRIPVGVFTDWDIVVDVDAIDLDARVITAGDIMSPNLVTAPESLSIVETIELMRFKGVRRLPVVNGDNQLVGIVTLDDLLAVLSEALAGIAHVVSRAPISDRREGRARK